MYKIASLETSDLNLIKAVAETGKPLIISTGATEWAEIEELVEVVQKIGNKDLTLMVCTSAYPADPVDANLKRLETIKRNFDVKVGLSDHTLGIGVSIAAIALGATVIEKHITLSRSDGGADCAFSMEPEEFATLVLAGTAAHQAIGKSEWIIQKSEMESRRLRRSLYIVQNVSKGDFITNENIRAIRPGGGCPPKYIDEMLGKTFAGDFQRGTPMSSDLIQGDD
jgi:N-acetylneuraminate synthase